MSIRVTLLVLFVVALMIYAWRDWFVSLCGLILLMAVIEHPDMPKSVMDIQGLNVWNILMADILLAWIVARRREHLVWDMPRHMMVLLFVYLVVVLVGFLRMLAEPSGMPNDAFAFLISEYFINTIKWVIPGLLLFDGCRTKRRLTLAVACVVGLYVFLGLQVIRWMPPQCALDADLLHRRGLKIIANEIGYSRVNMSRMLAGASWAALALFPLFRKRSHRVGVVLGFLGLAYAQALTGGRMGYVTWGALGVLMGVLRWRKMLLVLPFLVLVMTVAMPGAVDRMFYGFDQMDASGETYTDDYRVTSGRSLIWPHVVERILESPSIGYGRQAMPRIGLTEYLADEYGRAEAFPHPHNAYLEFLLDNGVLGFLLVMPFYVLIVYYAGRLFLCVREPWASAVGGIGVALLLAFLVSAIGSQTFYPREGDFGMWCAIGLVLRYTVEQRRNRTRASAIAESSHSVFPAR